jgi:hypothetical protein
VTKLKKVLSLIFTLCIFASFVKAQKTEITISLNEQFFDVLLDSMFQHSAPPEFGIAAGADEEKGSKGDAEISFSGADTFGSSFKAENGPPLYPPCNETIRLLRETNNVRTSVRLRDGKILAPIAFSGSYSPPFIGCVDFAGVADASIDLEFDAEGQRLIGRAKIVNVALNGTGGVGGSVIARLVQSSIDKKINPIEIIRMDKISFVVPIQNSGSLKMKATRIRHDISGGNLNVHIAYEFQKGP